MKNFFISTGPFDEVVTSDLHLRNPTKNTVLFMIKTTAPKQYCVRPNCGILEPSSSQTISG